MKTFLIVFDVRYLLIYPDFAAKAKELEAVLATHPDSFLRFICIDPRIAVDSNLHVEIQIVSIQQSNSYNGQVLYEIIRHINGSSKAYLIIDAPSAKQAQRAGAYRLGQTIALIPTDAKLLDFDPELLKIAFKPLHLEQLPTEMDVFSWEDETEMPCSLLCPCCNRFINCDCNLETEIVGRQNQIRKSYGLTQAGAYFVFHHRGGTLHSRLGCRDAR